MLAMNETPTHLEGADMNLNYEASMCTDDSCGASVVHKLQGTPKLKDGELCPRCDKPTLRVVRNPSIVATLAWQLNHVPKGS
jgi:Zn finger protein HypA/HybF involved in hydrogenase expression